MSRRQFWIEVRYRLVVVGIAAVVLAAGWLAGGRSVHLGPPVPYNPPQDPAYQLDLHVAGADATSLAGTITSHASEDCPNLVLLVNSGRGYLALGPVAVGQQVTFTAPVLGWNGRPVHMHPLWNVYLSCEPSTSIL